MSQYIEIKKTNRSHQNKKEGKKSTYRNTLEVAFAKKKMILLPFIAPAPAPTSASAGLGSMAAVALSAEGVAVVIAARASPV